MHSSPRLLAPALLSALSLAGCGSDSSGPAAGGGGGPTTALVAPALGQVYNAGIEARCMATGSVLGSGDTGSSGNVTVTLSGSCSGPVIVELVPNGGSSYYDEALATTVSLPVGTLLRAIVPSYAAGSPLTIAITPLTEIATRQALAAAGSEAAVTRAQATAANAAVPAQVLGAGVSFDILVPPTPWDATTAAGSLGTSAADRYAFYLAALAAMGSGSTPALAVTDALAGDLADGTLDGATSTDFTYTSGGYAALRDTGLADMAGYADSALKDSLGLTPPPPVDITGLSPASGAVDDQVTLTGTGFDSDAYHLEVKFANNVAAEIVSASATEIVVKVPAGAVSGSISVRNIISDTTDTSATFTVTGGGGDPATWTLRTSPSAFLLNGVAYGSSKFVTVGFNRTIMTSADGVSWASQTAADANFYAGNAVTWDGNQFVMVGDSSNLSSYAPLIATSPDGVTWTRRSWTHGNETQLNDVTGNASRLTAVGLNGQLISSTDAGVTWAQESLPAMASVASLSGVADNGSTRVAVGRDSSYYGLILVNTGSGWAQAGSAMATFAPREVIWNGSMWLVVGATSFNYGADAVVMYSTDGSNWTRVDLPADVVPVDYTLRDAAWTGSQFVAVGDNNGTSRIVITSADGATWAQAHTSTTSGNSVMESVAAGGGKVVAVGGTRIVTAP